MMDISKLNEDATNRLMFVALMLFCLLPGLGVTFQ